jgi:hypothetical protein
MKSSLIVPSLLLCLAGTVHAKPPLQVVDTADAIPVVPLRVAPATIVDGKIVPGRVVRLLRRFHPCACVVRVGRLRARLGRRRVRRAPSTGITAA